MTTDKNRCLEVQSLSCRRTWLILSGILLAFCVIRGPLMFRLPGAMDEEHFAVGGWTVANSGIPKNPLSPSRDRKSIFYKADEALFAMPPAFFYWSSPYFLLLPGGYGTARLGSALAGIITVILVARLGRAIWDDASGLWAAGLYSLSRFFYFSATTARPDMLCGMFGVASALALWHWKTTRLRRYLVAAGVMIGLGGLTHPFALAFAMLAGVWVAVHSRSIKEAVRDVTITGAVTALVMGLWLPLILNHMELFQIQFYNNIIHPEERGLVSQLIRPWESLAYHVDLLWSFVGPIQFAMVYGSLLLISLIAFRRGSPSDHGGVWLIVLAVVLLIVCQGKHYANGYWCYGGALLFLAVGRLVMVVSERITAVGLSRTAATGLLAVASCLLMVPGSGIRTWVQHIRNWDNPNYDSPRFTAAMIQSIPEQARCTVGDEFVLDFFLAGRKTISSHTRELYFDADKRPYDFLILSRIGLSNSLDKDFPGAVLQRVVGDEDDIFSCYARIYRNPQSTAPQSTAPQSIAPQSIAPQSIAPQSIAPQSIAPQSIAPQSIALDATR